MRLGAAQGQSSNLIFVCTLAEVTQEYALLYEHSFIHVSTIVKAPVRVMAFTHFFLRTPWQPCKTWKSLSTMSPPPMVGSTWTCALINAQQARCMMKLHERAKTVF